MPTAVNEGLLVESAELTHIPAPSDTPSTPCGTTTGLDIDAVGELGSHTAPSRLMQIIILASLQDGK